MSQSPTPRIIEYCARPYDACVEAVGRLTVVLSILEQTDDNEFNDRTGGWAGAVCCEAIEEVRRILAAAVELENQKRQEVQ